MPVVRGCLLPDELFYDVARDIWYRDNGDGTFTGGMTKVATGMSGPVVAITPKKAGKMVTEGNSCAVIESGKWVGPAKLAFRAEILEVNERLNETPSLANSDTYGAGWLFHVRPYDFAAAKALLTPGTEVAGPYEAKMAADRFPGCEG